MTNRELKAINISLVALGYKLVALQKALTADQRIIYEASLKESRSLIEKGQVLTLSPEERRILLQALGAV